VITEADTCRKYVLPKLYAAGWNDDQISEQKSFTDGRILVVGNKARRRPAKRADYLLRYARDFMLAVVEAKAAYKLPGDGLQQAKDYAEILGVKFAYSTNGHGIVEFDFTTGQERHLESLPKPAESNDRALKNEHRGEKLQEKWGQRTIILPDGRQSVTPNVFAAFTASGRRPCGGRRSFHGWDPWVELCTNSWGSVDRGG
jgi:type I restriction enzyme, R subunit